jgi:hypothetical protein
MPSWFCIAVTTASRLSGLASALITEVLVCTFSDGAGDDDAAVSVVTRDIVKGVRQFLVRRTTPLERAALAMQRHLDNAVAAFHRDVLVLVLVFLELAHAFSLLPCGCADTNR